MHPRAGARALAAGQRSGRGAGAARLRARARRRCTRARSTRTSRTARSRNYWGGSSSATTHLLERHALPRPAARRAARRRHPHLRGARARARAARTRPRDAPALDALVDVVVRKYAPLPAPSLSCLVRRLRYAVPQWRRELTARWLRAKAAARARAGRRRRLVLAGRRDACPARRAPTTVRLLAPFDPVVWDRRRFELLWGWAYRFEAYTPVAQAQARLLRAAAAVARPRDRLGQRRRSTDGALQARLGYVSGRRPRERGLRRRARGRADGDAGVPRTARSAHDSTGAT